MARISTDDGKSINCKEKLSEIMEKMNGIRLPEEMYTWPREPFIEVVQIGGDFTEDDMGELSFNEWQKPSVVFVRHITRILE